MVCIKCKKEKEASEFYADKNMPNGRRKDCKECKNLSTYAWRSSNLDYYNQSMREYQAENPLRRDDCDLKRKYGVSREWFDSTLEAQDNRCAICKKLNSSTKRRLVVDHCHKSGKVRGILCYGCNRLMVLLDNPDLLAKAQDYKIKY